MTAAVGQIGTNFDGNGATITTAAVNTSASGSDFIVLVWVSNTTNAPGVPTDTFSNTYVQIGTGVNDAGGGNDILYRYRCYGGTGGSSHTVTIASISGAHGIAATLIELTGCNTTAAYDNGNTSTGTSDPFLTANVAMSPTTTGEVLVSGLIYSSGSTDPTITENNGFTVAYNFGDHVKTGMHGAMAYKVVTTSANYQASYNMGGGKFAASSLDGFLGAAAVVVPFTPFSSTQFFVSDVIVQF